jgi:hypothetical protein
MDRDDEAGQAWSLCRRVHAELLGPDARLDAVIHTEPLLTVAGVVPIAERIRLLLVESCALECWRLWELFCLEPDLSAWVVRTETVARALVKRPTELDVVVTSSHSFGREIRGSHPRVMVYLVAAEPLGPTLQSRDARETEFAAEILLAPVLVPQLLTSVRRRMAIARERRFHGQWGPLDEPKVWERDELSSRSAGRASRLGARASP